MNECNAEHQQLVDDCQVRESHLSEWECTFIASVGEQLARGRTLSSKQAATLDEIWKRVTAHGVVR